MDIRKERDLYLAELLEREVITQYEFRDLVFKPEINAFDSNYLSSWFIDKINFGWSAWQAKAQAVPASINDIRSWIAVNSFSALDAVHDNVPIVDANELAKYIDSLDLSVSVPEGFVLVPKKATKKMLDAGYEAHDGFFSNGAVQDVYVAMIEAQEPANEL